MRMQNNKVSKLKKSWLVIAGILLVLLGVLIYSNFMPPNPPNYDGYSKAALRMFYFACNVFWEEKGADKNCVAEGLSEETHGFSMGGHFSKVKLEGEGNRKTFSATAFHKNSLKIFEINKDGKINLLIEMSEYR